MTVWSLCMFAFELDILEIRLATLDAVVDRHVIVEAPLTHAGTEKPLLFWENRDRFAKWAQKIDHLVDHAPPGGHWAPRDAAAFAESDSDHWRREHHQRDALTVAVADADDRDLILISDCDEIPDPARAWRNAIEIADAGVIGCPLLAMHVGRLRWRWPLATPGTRTRFLSGRTFRRFGTVERVVDAPNVIFGQDGNPAAGAGWHLAYMGGVTAIQQKLASFAHQELNRPPFNTPEHISHCLETGEDLFMRPDRVCESCSTGAYPPHALAEHLRYLW